MGLRPMPRRIRIIWFNSSFLIMRKYLRLILCVIALVCCLLMFVYHHKYARLNLVFEMMNVIGRNKYDVNCSKKAQETSSHKDWTSIEMASGLPVWTEAFPNLYLYSSFWLGNRTRTLALLDPNDIQNIRKLMCQLYYPSQRLEKGGYVKPQVIHSGEELSFAFLDCHLPPSLVKIPYGIKFLQHSNESSPFLPVVSKEAHTGTFSMCVEPLPIGFDNVHRIIEFLVYHHHFGVSHFIFYDYGLAPSVKQLLLDIAPKCNIFVTLLPWNAHYAFKNSSQFSHSDYFIDCSHRVVIRNYSSYVINSNINQFIVFKNGRNLTTLANDKELEDVAQFYEHLFCAEYKDDTVADHLDIQFVTLLKTKTLPTTNTGSLTIYNVKQLHSIMYSADFVNWFHGPHPNVVVLSKTAAVLHSYVKCDNSFWNAFKIMESEKVMVDKYMWRYKNLFFKSRLYNFAKQYELLNIV